MAIIDPMSGRQYNNAIFWQPGNGYLYSTETFIAEVTLGTWP